MMCLVWDTLNSQCWREYSNKYTFPCTIPKLQKESEKDKVSGKSRGFLKERDDK
jgi:hypothetical protein